MRCDATVKDAGDVLLDPIPAWFEDLMRCRDEQAVHENSKQYSQVAIASYVLRQSLRPRELKSKVFSHTSRDKYNREQQNRSYFRGWNLLSLTLT